MLRPTVLGRIFRKTRSLRDLLFVAQRDHRIDAHGAASRNAARGDGDQRERDRDGGKGERVGGADVKEQAADEAR